MKVYFAADHAGFLLKNVLLAYVRDELHLDVEDSGAFELDQSDDYPEIIAAAAHSLLDDTAAGLESRMIVIGASGQGEAMAANRFKGVRCALYYGAPAKTQIDMSGKELDMLASVREHNNANALSLGARFLSEDAAKAAVKTWLSVDFPGDERHARRIGQLDTLA
jgi:ribose 5-phosphate isomerase B